MWGKHCGLSASRAIRGRQLLSQQKPAEPHTRLFIFGLLRNAFSSSLKYVSEEKVGV